MSTPSPDRGSPTSFPAQGILVARLAIDPLRIGEVREALEATPVRLGGWEVRTPVSEGSFEQDLYLEYKRLDDLQALLQRLRGLARKVTTARAWCPECSCWHAAGEEGLRLLAPDGAACRSPGGIRHQPW